MLFGKGKDVLYASILSRIQVQAGMILTGNELPLIGLNSIHHRDTENTEMMMSTEKSFQP